MRWFGLCLLLCLPHRLLAQTLGVYPVRAYGAVGDGRTDDTDAFRRACTAADAVGGTVLVEPVKPGGGYVLTGSVAIPKGVSLVGARAGMPFFLWEGVPRGRQRGAVILARPPESDYREGAKKPLFELLGGNTVRGLYILYDEQPWPSDKDFDDANSPYRYDSFEELRERFVPEHVKPYGPTFYGRHVASSTIEDVTCARYWDFCLFDVAGKVFIERCYLYGYKRAFAIQRGPDTIRIRGIHVVPNVQTAIAAEHTKLHAAIAWHDDNVVFDFADVDGYSISDVVGFLVNTGFRLGSSETSPFVNTVTGERYASRWGGGSWGSIQNVKLDNVAVGFRCLTGTILTNQLQNVMTFVSLPVAETVETTTGPVARQAAFLIEPGFAGATLQIQNLLLSSSAPRHVLAGATMVQQAGGRAFLLDCPGIAERKDYANRESAHLNIFGLTVSNIPSALLIGATPDNRADLRAAGFVHNGVRQPDLVYPTPAE